jgi:hypothetical protein
MPIRIFFDPVTLFQTFLVGYVQFFLRLGRAGETSSRQKKNYYQSGIHLLSVFGNVKIQKIPQGHCGNNGENLCSIISLPQNRHQLLHRYQISCFPLPKDQLLVVMLTDLRSGHFCTSLLKRSARRY